jgi:hypothetical protein
VTDHYEEVTCDCLACHISRIENEDTSLNSKSTGGKRSNVCQISLNTKTENEERNNICQIPKFEEETNSKSENDDDDSNYNYSYDDAVTAKTK